ncbi:hypothetical protein, partial [Mesorhizobium sp. M4B.F.Ca.ET.190.01.1.1]|uniref:hypothetical protein n=1 Tax=Mesorhizobium sp. M4B.F.Ca.ET.190.01.1.1 TaxID=2563951 RepID=UPI001AEEF02B
IVNEKRTVQPDVEGWQFALRHSIGPFAGSFNLGEAGGKAEDHPFTGRCCAGGHGLRCTGHLPAFQKAAPKNQIDAE